MILSGVLLAIANDSVASGGVKSTKYLKQEHFAYDIASNRTGNQANTVTRAGLSGAVTAGDVLTITTTDSGLSGDTKAVSYTVQSGDTLALIAANFAAAIASDADLQSIGVTASPSSSILSIKSSSPNVTTYAATKSGGATESIAVGYTDNFVENAVIGGSKTTGDVLTLTFKDAALSGGQKSLNYTVLSGDTLTSIATALKSAINADTDLQALAVTATSIGTSITIKSTSTNATTYAQSVSTGATESIALSINPNEPVRIGIGGTKTTGDTVSIVAFDLGLSGGSETASFTVLSGDNLPAIAAGLATAINANANLQNVGISASASGQVLTVSTNSLNETNYRGTTSSAATEVLLVGLPENGIQTAVVGGTKTTGDVLTITVYDAGLSGGSEAVAYTILSGDNLTSIATNMAAAINADTNLQNINVTATSSGAVVFVDSSSISATTYTKSLSGGATETLALGPSTSANLYGYNNLNELTSIAAGGPTKFKATANKALINCTVNATPASLFTSLKFHASPSLISGINTVSVVSTDAGSSTATNNYDVVTTSSASATPAYVANGNMISDGEKTFVWDAEDRLLQINYPGTANITKFTCDPLDRFVKQIEFENGTLVYTGQFIDDDERLEERNDMGSITKQFFQCGELVGGAKFFYAVDHNTSVREVVDNSGFLLTEFMYDVFGRRYDIKQTMDPSFGYSHYCFHTRSGLSVNQYRQYDPKLARWLNRDPIEESDSTNLYGYVHNAPINSIDPSGLLTIDDMLKIVPPNNKSNKSNEWIICWLWQESSFNAKSARYGLKPENPKGLGQTTKWAFAAAGVKYSLGRAFDAATNIQVSSAYLQSFLNNGSGMGSALNNYGTGSGHQKDIDACEKCLQSKLKTHKEGTDDLKCCLEIEHK